MRKRVYGFASLTMSVFVAVAVSVAACAPSTSSTNTNRSPLSTALPAHETLYVLDGGSSAAGALRIVAIHPGAGDGATVTLPAGLATQDHQHLYVATPRGEQTAVSILDTRTGATMRTFTIAGRYATDTHGYGGATLTLDGRWLALRRVGQQGGDQSTIALIDTAAGKVTQTLQLAGDFDIDALAPDGTVLYLLQNLHDAQHRYYVRAYDIGVGKLLDQIIVDKSEINNPKMQGAAVARRFANTGAAAAYTLYVDPLRNTAFVHVLSLDSTGRVTPFARCVDDLPASQSLDLLRAYTLVLSPDGSTLYAVNAALGVATKITASDGALNAQVVAASHFAPMGSASGDVGYGGILSNGAALSADGSTLYVAGAHGLQLIRTGDMEPLGTYLTGHTLTSVALSANGNALYVTDASQGVLLVSADGMQSERLAAKGLQSLGGIAWVGN